MSAHTMSEVWDQVERALLETAHWSLDVEASAPWSLDSVEHATAIYGTVAQRLGLASSLAEWRRAFAAYLARQEQAEEGAP